MTHETSWQTCPRANELLGNFPQVHFLTEYDHPPKSEIRAGEVNVQHRARDETLDPGTRSSVHESPSVFVVSNDLPRIGPGKS